MTDGTLTMQRLAAYVPARSWTVEQIGQTYGLTRYQARMFRRIRGMDTVHFDPDLPLFDLLAAPARTVLDTVADPRDIKYLIYAHTFPDVTPSFLFAAEQVRQRLALTEADAFAVTQQFCASGLAALDVAGELLRAHPDPAARALVITGEKPFLDSVRFLLNVSITGEASTACLVGLDGAGSRVLSQASRTEGEFVRGFRMSPETLRKFGETYNEYLWSVMSEALDRAAVTLPDIDMIVPHNVNVTLWLQLCARIGLHRDRIFLDNMARYGHCFSSDPLLNLTTMGERGLLVKGRLYLLTAVGIGSTYAAAVIEY